MWEEMAGDRHIDAQALKSNSNVDRAMHDLSPEALMAAAADPGLTEDLALALLKRADITPGALEQLANNSTVMKYRKTKLALITHPKTPRHLSVPLARQLYVFDLMQVALTATAPADVKIAADDALVLRLESVTLGERLSLARRASGRVAAALLADKEPRVMEAALHNPRLTEAALIKNILRPDSTAVFINAVCRNAKWSVRQEVCLALLRNEKTPVCYAVQFGHSLSREQLLQILLTSHLPVHLSAALEADLGRR
jgi:hypothetical protein